MNVLLINDYDDLRGGAQTYDHVLQSLLESRGHEVAFFTGKDRGLLHNFRSKLYDHSDVKRMQRVLRSFRPDVAFAHSVGYTLSPLLLRAVHRRGVPICMKIPDLHLYEYPTFNLRRPYSIATFPQVLMHRYLVRLYVDEFVAPSEHMASWIRSELDPKSPVSVIRNPSIIEPIDTVPAPDVNRVLFVGRLDGKKGVDHLISAFDDESLQDTAITLDIVGDGSAKPALEALVGERDLGATVTFHGRVSHEKIAPYYRRASVFVLPAVIEENAPLTIPEAMSQGTPVVTTNIGGQQELVEDGETGLLVEPEDSTAIAQAIRTIVDDEGRLLSMASAAHRRACELSLDAHASEIEEELTKLVERDQSPTKRLPESGAE